MEKLSDGFRGEKAIVTPYSIRTLQSENQFTKNLFVTHIGYYPTAKHHFRNRDEGAPESIFIYCEKGQGWVRFKDQEYLLKNRQAFIIPANETHTYAADEFNPWSIYWLHFRGELTNNFLSIMSRVLSLPEGDETSITNRMLLFDDIYRNLEMGYQPENLEYASICLQHFLASFKYISQYSKNSEDGIVQKSIVHMKNNLEKKLTLVDLAQHVGYSISHYGALFTENTSYSPIVYFNQLKIQRACSLLQFTDLKIKEIAFQLGYYDPFHFSKAFHNEMEISPREYRSRYGGGDE